ncbi:MULTISPECIES: peptidylprolyl isomerase [Sporosarcina]|uniref:peptidylprolyl isomerase n=1 Tax=Sporosarcina TaxID=1569 RepID=UPI0006942F08|nr:MULTISPECIES: peptidylprolyl isomerase [Sporosarcina]WJY27704.1 peptidylprolyl isomerase [Sporosarcina sp. 0.2-SM1T-5]
MKKTVLSFTLAASVLALSACSGNASDDEAIVTSKDGDISKSEFYKEMKDSVGEQAVQMMVIEKVLESKYDVSDKDVQAEYDDAKKQLGDNFDQYLASQGQTEQSFKKSIKLNKLQEAALTDGIEVSDDEVNKYLEEKNVELKASHILLDDEEKAKEVQKKAEAGEDFAKLAKEYSTEEAAQQSGGELGWFKKGDMVDEFWQGALKLKKGEISGPVQSEHGFHIIKLEDKKVDDKKPSKEDKEKAKEELKMNKADSSKLVDKVSKLVKDADVKVKDKDLKGALDLFNQSQQAPADDAGEPGDVETDTDSEK